MKFQQQQTDMFKAMQHQQQLNFQMLMMQQLQEQPKAMVSLHKKEWLSPFPFTRPSVLFGGLLDFLKVSEYVLFKWTTQSICRLVAF